jgi:hypothetical protein
MGTPKFDALAPVLVNFSSKARCLSFVKFGLKAEQSYKHHQD